MDRKSKLRTITDTGSSILLVITVIVAIHTTGVFCRLKLPSDIYEPNWDESFDNWTIEYYKNHPCNRECIIGQKPRVCHYTFAFEKYQILSRACHNCPNAIEDCFRLHCCVGDGVSRTISTYNRMLVGPKIEVCLNDIIVVDVINHMLGEETTIHWHGLHQKETPYMDGVPLITQCPIPNKKNFTYEFRADLAGTFFYHSHIDIQRLDGAVGALIIREPRSTNWHSHLYDHDLSEHSFVIFDWLHDSGVDAYTDALHARGDRTPKNILVNGFGRDRNGIKAAITEEERERLSNTPLSFTNVTQGERYRFRLINAGSSNCPIAVSVDDHELNIISTDGFDVEPTKVGSVILYAGERFDFVLEANQPVANYWMRFKGLLACAVHSAFQTGILHYEGAPIAAPESEPVYEFTAPGIQLNTLTNGAPNTLTVADLRGLAKYDVSQAIGRRSLKKEPDQKIFIGHDFYQVENTLYHHPKEYSIFDQNTTFGTVLSPQFNHITFDFPSTPILSYRFEYDKTTLCNETSLQQAGRNCTVEFCKCTHLIEMKKDSVIEIIFVGGGQTFRTTHPKHLHGFAFRVVASQMVGESTSVEEVKELDRLDLIERNLDNPPIKDTIMVYDGGFTVVRLESTNPGYWFLHCHISDHAELGMDLIFKVGEDEDMVPVPKGFPRCDNYTPDIGALLKPSPRPTPKPKPKPNPRPIYNSTFMTRPRLNPHYLNINNQHHPYHFPYHPRPHFIGPQRHPYYRMK